MKTVATIRAVRAWHAAGEGSLGLVPTMGYLHAGHVSLVERARRENDRVAASIFVNPTQFGPKEDLASYPRDLQRDLRLLEDAGCDVVFVPAVAEMYPAGTDTFVVPGRVAEPLEGARRPGHLRGVATVVAKLFNIVAPDRAYFGEKDAQQLAIIEALAADLNMPIAIVPVPTVRESDGLAISSRNVRLDPRQRGSATALYRALRAAAARIAAGAGPEDAREAALKVMREEPSIRVEYLEIVDPESMQPVDEIRGTVRIAAAVWAGETRLIDNVLQ
jgi:pantoate--beta-alanine ligase